MKPKSDTTEKRNGMVAWLFPRLLLSLGGLLVALVITEVLLRVMDRPRFYEPHSDAVQFAFTNLGDANQPFYVNQPGRITFEYDGNPRDYFNEKDEVHHDVNPSGFRGPAIRPKREDTFRLLFLGDSFTFGEGVRNEHTFAEQTARNLRKNGRRIEPCNMGVGGYNTSQSAKVLETFGFDMHPDVVILGYTLNDAEPPLFKIDPKTGQAIRREREKSIESEAAPRKPPSSLLFRLHIAQAIWQLSHQRHLTKQTIDYYQSVNSPSNEGRIESERALREIISTCRERDIPCIVVMFPLFFDLSKDYPFKDVHERTERVVEEAGAEFIDLLPELVGKSPQTLIVHPTDQHPNETIHEITGSLLAEEISQFPEFKKGS